MAIGNHYFFPVPSFPSQSPLRKPSKNLDWGLRLWVRMSLWICWKVIERKLGLILGVKGLIETIFVMGFQTSFRRLALVIRAFG